METLLISSMVAGGALLALLILAISRAVARRSAEKAERVRPRGSRDEIAGAILFHIASEGGAAAPDARRIVEAVGWRAPPAQGVVRDIGAWASAYAAVTTRKEREAMLDAAMRAAMMAARPVSLAHYAALLEVCFALGFHTDALARLRTRYRAELIDFSVNRPEGAERSGAPAAGCDRLAQLALFGFDRPVSRRELSSAYRRLAAASHPDHYHQAPESEKAAAAARFIEITQAYDSLLPLCIED